MTCGVPPAATVPGPMHPALDIARVTRRPTRLDLGIAGVFLLWGVLEAVLAEGPGSTAVRLLGAVGWVAPLLVRRRFPIAAMGFLAALLALRAATAGVDETGAMPVPVILLLAFGAGLYTSSTARAVAGLLLAIACIPVGNTYFTGGDQPTDYAILAFFIGGAWVAGRLVRRRADQLAAEQARAPELAREAVAAERARVAREVHDIVAHSVSIIAVQAGAAEELLDHDPARARPHLRAVRETAHEALVEMRRLLDVLREDDPSYAPQPGLERVGELVEQASAAGVPVTLEVDGRRAAVPAGVDLAGFRIVQEALTNVRKHAGEVATTVRIRYRPEAIDIEVLNARGRSNGGPPGSGRGLPGMRERARLYGGQVDAGPERDGFAVRASLPLEGERA